MGRLASRAFPRYAKVAAFTAIVVGLAWLLTRHLIHGWQWLPYLLILACPLMHIFHHGRHGGHPGRAGRPEDLRAE